MFYSPACLHLGELDPPPLPRDSPLSSPFPYNRRPEPPFPPIHDHIQSQEEWATATASTFVASGEVANDSFRKPGGQTLKPHSVVAGLPPSFQAAQAALKRKYRHLRRALGKDGMLFADEIFEIRPLEGDIWARSEIEVRYVLVE